jgi:hypothetical protein
MQYVHLAAEIFGWVMMVAVVTSFFLVVALLRARDEHSE